MSQCEECGQPVHPHQMTCGSCGASLREQPAPAAPSPLATPDELEKPDDDLSFTLDDPLVLGDEQRLIDTAPPDSDRHRRRRRRVRSPGPASSRAFFSRTWALVVDGMFLAVACGALPAIARLGIRAAEAVAGTPELYDDVITEELTSVGRIALIASYFVFMNAGSGQTLGKGLMGLHVVRVDGRPPDVLVSLIRTVGYVFSALPMGFGFLLAAAAPRRALHDYLAGTIVVRLRDMPGAGSEDEPT